MNPRRIIFSLTTALTLLVCHRETRAQIALREQTIALETGVHLAYVEHGDARGLPVILLHGFTDSWRSYEDVIPLLPEDIHAFAITQRGHGTSSKPQDLSFKSFAADIASFIRQKKLGSAIIVGHSMGGLVAQRFVIDYPELAQGMVIVSSEAHFADNEGMPGFLEEVSKLQDPIGYPFAEGFQKSTIVKPVDSARVEVYIGESLRVPARVWAAISKELSITDFRTEVRAIAVPTLILWGNRDSICPESDQQAFAASIKNSTMLIYDGTGHALHWEDGKRFVRDVTSFVNMVVEKNPRDPRGNVRQK